MSYNVAGSGMRSAVCRALMLRYGDEMSVDEHVEATMLLHTDGAFLEQDAPQAGETMGRPCLVLTGRVVELRGEFPYDISTIRFQEEADRKRVTYRYELSRENLTELCSKGMFEPGFEVPNVIRDNEFELPCEVACAALAPSGDEPPVIFADVVAASCECDDVASGYTISEYFETMPRRDYFDALEGERQFEPEVMTPEAAAVALEREPEVVSEPVVTQPRVEEREALEHTPRRPEAPKAPEPRVPSKPRKQDRKPSSANKFGVQAPAKPAATPVQPDLESPPDLNLGDEYI